MGTHADMSPLSKGVPKEDKNDTPECGERLRPEERPPCRLSGADAGPPDGSVGAKFEPQVGVGVKVQFGTGLPVEGFAGDDFRAVNVGEAAVAVGTRSDSEVGNSGVQVRDGLKTGAEVDQVPSCAQPRSGPLRSKERRHRSSHRLALHYIVPCMNSYGVCIVDNFLGSRIGDRILQEVRELRRAGRMRDGELAGRGPEHARSVRGDQIIWVDGKEADCQNIGYLLSRMDRLITYADGRLGNHKIRGRNSKLLSVISCRVVNFTFTVNFLAGSREGARAYMRLAESSMAAEREPGGGGV